MWEALRTFFRVSIDPMLIGMLRSTWTSNVQFRMTATLKALT